MLETVAQATRTELPVLLQGPSGLGKERIAASMHLNSPCARRPFRIVDRGAAVPTLLESKLFNPVRGAFTGATSDKPGLIPWAHCGTLPLDEVGELPRDLQVKLLRVLQF